MMPPTEDQADASGQPLFETDPDATYTLDVVAELTGVSTQTILHYREHGLLPAVPANDANTGRYDLEALRKLRHIEQLRTLYEMNMAGLKAMLELADEVESLQSSLRTRR